MTLPPDLQAFSRLPIWNSLLFLLAVGIVGYSGWSFLRQRQRADLYYLLLGAYLIAFQAPIDFPFIGQALGVTCPLSGNFVSKFLVVLPAAALFTLAVRSD